MPVPVRSRSATRPTDSPAAERREERPARVRERHDVDADPAPRDATNQRLERRVGDGLHRRRHRRGRRGAPARTTGSSIAPKCMPTMMTGDPPPERRRGRPSVVVDVEPREGVVEVVGAAPGRPRGSSARAWRKAARTSRSSASGSVAARRAAALPAAARREALADAGRFARAWARRAGARRYQSSPMDSAAATSGRSGQARRPARRAAMSSEPRRPDRGRGGASRAGAASTAAGCVAAGRRHDAPVRVAIACGLERPGLGRVVGPHGLEAVPLLGGGGDRGLQGVGDPLGRPLEVGGVGRRRP